MERQERIEVFRGRLEEVIERSGLSRGAFATRIGLDRSTLSQVLSPQGRRLPRAETVAAIAELAQVSADWLLGLSQEGRLGTDLVNQGPEIETGAGRMTDARLQAWHREAIGYKIRYVPTSLPDLLMGEEVIEFEYGAVGGLAPAKRLEEAEERLAYTRRPETDLECCSPRQSIESFVRGEGVWRDMPRADRRRQVEVMIARLNELYPTFRWFLFDARRHYAAPFTIFGPQRAALYVGSMYFVFNSIEHIRVLTRYFDLLIRDATVQPHEVASWLRRLLTSLD